MFHAIRLIIGLGLLTTLGFTVSYLIMGNQRHLVIALRTLLLTFALAVVLGLGIWIETSTR